MCEKSWKEAGGFLSGHGTKVQFDRGQELRQRYMNSSSITRIQRDFNATTEAIYVSARSTDVDRTLLSAEALLLGLMQSGGPVDEWTGEYALPNGVHPVPIHSTSTSQDLEMRAFGIWQSSPIFKQLFLNQNISSRQMSRDARSCCKRPGFKQAASLLTASHGRPGSRSRRQAHHYRQVPQRFR